MKKKNKHWIARQKKEREKKKRIFIASTALGVIGLGILGYFLWNNYYVPPQVWGEREMIYEARKEAKKVSPEFEEEIREFQDELILEKPSKDGNLEAVKEKIERYMVGEDITISDDDKVKEDNEQKDRNKGGEEKNKGTENKETKGKDTRAKNEKGEFEDEDLPSTRTQEEIDELNKLKTEEYDAGHKILESLAKDITAGKITEDELIQELVNKKHTGTLYDYILQGTHVIVQEDASLYIPKIVNEINEELYEMDKTGTSITAMDVSYKNGKMKVVYIWTYPHIIKR